MAIEHNGIAGPYVQYDGLPAQHVVDKDLPLIHPYGPVTPGRYPTPGGGRLTIHPAERRAHTRITLDHLGYLPFSFADDGRLVPDPSLDDGGLGRSGGRGELVGQDEVPVSQQELFVVDDLGGQPVSPAQRSCRRTRGSPSRVCQASCKPDGSVSEWRTGPRSYSGSPGSVTTSRSTTHLRRIRCCPSSSTATNCTTTAGSRV